MRPEKDQTYLEEYEIRTNDGVIEVWLLDEKNIKELNQSDKNNLNKMSDTARLWQPAKWRGQNVYYQKNGGQYLMTLEINLIFLNQIYIIAAR